MKVEGYDYAGFCRAVAGLRGRGCWVERLLRARHGVAVAAYEAAALRRLMGCDGEFDGHHLISKQRLKVTFYDDPPFCGRVLMDSRNGVVVCRRHHDLLERRLVVPTRDELPGDVEDFAAALGMEWSLDRDFGGRRGEAVA